MSKMNLICCGGTGINVGRPFAQFSGKTVAGAATLSTVFIDASDSNIDEQTPPEMTYLIDNIDGTDKLKGGGKIRSTNYVAIEQAIPGIVHQFEPAETHLIVFSTSGGSGNVIGLLTAAELVSRGESVVVLAIGTSGSLKEVENTIHTLGSFESMIENIEEPINVLYREVGLGGKTRGKIDEEIRTAISIMQVLFSGQNKELDEEDVKNTLFFNRPLKCAPKLGHLDLYSKEIVLEKGQFLVSTLTVVDQDVSPETNIPTEFHSVGYINPVARKTLVLPAPIHMGISIGNFFHNVMVRFQAKKQAFEANRNLIVEKSIVSKDVKKTAKGMILD